MDMFKASMLRHCYSTQSEKMFRVFFALLKSFISGCIRVAGPSTIKLIIIIIENPISNIHRDRSSHKKILQNAFTIMHNNHHINNNNNHIIL